MPPGPFWVGSSGARKSGLGPFWACLLGVAPLRYGHEPGRWVACDYAVRPPVLEGLLGKLGVTPERDAFATEGNKRFEKWYGEGSPEGEDAFEKDWGSEILWINHPFNVISRVLDKIVKDRAHAVLIVPYWRKYKFFGRAQ